jgi:hypothetical protein
MNRLGVLLALWVGLLVLLVPVVTPIQYGAVQGGAESGAPGGAYVLVQPDSIAPGDVVRYWDVEADVFRLATVEEVTVDGYVVAPSDDASDTRRHVPAFTVVGTPVQLSGTPLVVPVLGYVTPFVQTVQSLVLAVFLLVSAAIAYVVRSGSGHRHRGVVRVRQVFLPLLLVIIVATLAITPMGATSYRVAYEFDTGTVADVGEEETISRSVSARYRKPLFTHLVVETGGVETTEWRYRNEVLTVTLSIPPVRELQTSIAVFPYLAVLPRPLVVRLHAIHPLFAMLATSSVVVAPLALAYALFVDGRRPAPKFVQRLLG